MGLLDRLRRHKQKGSTARAEPSSGDDIPTPAKSPAEGSKNEDVICAVQEVSSEHDIKKEDGETTGSVVAALDDAAAVEASPPPKTPKDADCETSAYYTAWANLTDAERTKLGSDRDMRQLFAQLDEADQAHSEKSRFARGLKVISPYLKDAGSIVELGGTLASLHPIASMTHGIVTTSIKILATVCSAGEDLSEEIQSFLLKIPAIERVNDVVKGGAELPDIHKILVLLYGDLFSFIIKVDATLGKENFATLAIAALRRQLPGIVSSFNKHAETLSTLLEAETAATVLEIKEYINDASLGGNLDVEEVSLNALREELKHRDSSACAWIAGEPDFAAWRDATSTQNVLVLLGDKGCGKTMTTAYVADEGVPDTHVVCSYYITGGTQTATTASILRSIMAQLLQASPHMKRAFLRWFRDATQPSNSFRRMSYDAKIREFLRRALLAAEDHVYVVLDALDECDVGTLQDVLELFGGLLEAGARVKLFASMRYDDEAEGLLAPLGAVTLGCKTSMEQSRAVAAFHARRLNIDAGMRERVVEEVIARAEGSPLWIRMALEYLRKPAIRNEKGLSMAMDKIATCKTLTDMYWKLFEKCAEGDAETEAMIVVALETLAVARRPLTVEELAYAVCIDVDRENKEDSIEALDELAHSRGFLDVVRPFVRKLQVPDGEDQLQLVHHSLKELLLRAPPSEWVDVSKKTVKKGQEASRKPQLEANLMRRCVNYLLYDECETNQLPFLESFVDLMPIDDPFDTDTAAAAAPEEDASEKNPKFNPKDLGFGGFFTYAASAWLDHYGAAAPGMELGVDELIALCSKDTVRTCNWIEQWRRPRCFYTTHHGIFMLESVLQEGKVDPLTIASVFGSARSIAAVLRSEPAPPQFYADTVSLCVANLVGHREPAVLAALLADQDLSSSSSSSSSSALDPSDVLWQLAYGFYQKDMMDEWDAVLDVLIERCRDFLLEYGNAILCGAAGHRALPLVQRLFAAADHDAELRAALLTTEIKLGERYKVPLHAHQSVGEAARGRRADIVRFLCSQDGIAPHLHYRDAAGNTAFHVAVLQSWYQTADVLLEFWPEGLLQENDAGEDPLTLYMYNTLTDAPRMLEFLRKVLVDEVVKRTMREEKGKEVAAVVAQGLARYKHAKSCCRLIREGKVKLEHVLVLEDGKIVLKEEACGGDGSEDVLAELCYLMPLAMGTIDLFMQ